MVYIKKLEIYGFKSFGFKNTVLNLNNGLVAVTGPNGSGKSNILDAIMFALGENSPKLLRVDKFQSLFHDSVNSSHRLVRVNVTFDNSDRGIPIDNDNVSMSREMEGQNGESQYYLNGKKVSKNTILELLEIMVAVPNKLNIVQQGMITRISELNSEERRKIIEDIVGLSYFDDKKNESLRQLEESDRRLEVSLARMDEIKKRINELESERNDQLRYAFIESQLKKFKAIKYSNKIKNLKDELDSRNKFLSRNDTNLGIFSKNRDDLRKEIEKIEQEKSSFMNQVDVSNKSKAQMDTKLTSVIYQVEREKAVIKEANLRLSSIEERFTFIESESKKIELEIENSSKSLFDKNSIINEKRSGLVELKNKLGDLNIRIDEISVHAERNKKLREFFFKKKSRLVEINSRVNILVAKMEEKKKLYVNNMDENNLAINVMRKSLSEKEVNLNNTSTKLRYSKVDTEKKFLNDLQNKSKIYSSEIDQHNDTVTKVQKFAMPYEEKFSVALELSNEDFAIADLMKHSHDFKIIGIVRDLIRYDEVYKNAVFAVGKNWMKCCIVPSVKEMIRIATYIKEKNLPHFKIISLEMLKSRDKKRVALSNYDFIGNLADLVQSSVPDLADFIFRNVLVVRNSRSAYDLAKLGYRCVTIAGELFEPHANAISLDFDSKMSDLTREIILSDSITSLLKSSKILSTYLESRRTDLEMINKNIANKELYIKELEKLDAES
ncbi:MAG TPA: AAA family ATPase, partial [Nitrososphaeraceae archaeon]|nr:AAA family ATPase [Nitrososphaeraceae archaeon]